MEILNRKTDYALRALIALRRNGRAVSTRELSKRCAVTLPLMRQIMHKLGTAGLVKTVRGAGGGFRLARSADDISLKDVIAVMQGEIRFNRCISNAEECAFHKGCNVTRELQRFQASFDKFTEDMILSKLCIDKIMRN